MKQEYKVLENYRACIPCQEEIEYAGSLMFSEWEELLEHFMKKHCHDEQTIEP